MTGPVWTYNPKTAAYSFRVTGGADELLDWITPRSTPPPEASMEEVQMWHLARALEAADGDMQRCAETTGLPEKRIWSLFRQHKTN